MSISENPWRGRPAMTIPPGQVSVLIVDDDTEFARALNRLLTSVGFKASIAHSATEAAAVIDRTSIDIVVTDLRMEGMDGLALLERLAKASPHTQAILMSAAASSRQHAAALQLGAVRVLSKPFDNAELLDAIRQAADCRVGVQGSVHGLALTDLLQMFHFGRRSVTIHISGRPSGNIHFEKGELVHAECGNFRGKHALRLLLARRSGTIQTTAIQTNQRTLHDALDVLLLDALREVDETSQRSPNLELGLDWAGTHQLLDPAELKVQIAECMPGANAWLIPPTLDSGAVLIGDLPVECIMSPVVTTLATLGSIEPDWKVAECVANELSLSLLKLSGGDILVVHADTSMQRGVERFRFRLARLKEQLVG